MPPKLCLVLMLLLAGCQAMSAPEFRFAIPNMMVKDVAQSATYYTHTLGFTQTGTGPNFAVLKRGQITVALIEASKNKLAGNSWCYLTVTQVPKVFEEFKSAGAAIKSPLSDWPNGHQEFTISDPDGNTLDVGN